MCWGLADSAAGPTVSCKVPLVEWVEHIVEASDNHFAAFAAAALVAAVADVVLQLLVMAGPVKLAEQMDEVPAELAVVLLAQLQGLPALVLNQLVGVGWFAAGQTTKRMPAMGLLDWALVLSAEVALPWAAGVLPRLARLDSLTKPPSLISGNAPGAAD